MRWPWQRAEVAPVDVAAVAREAADAAAERTRDEVFRALLAAPAQILGPQEPPQRPGAYAFDNPIFYSTPHAPRRRPDAPVTVDTLRRLADTWDILRACILHLRREVAAVPIEVSARDREDDSDATRKRVREATDWLESLDGVLGGPGCRRADYEGEVLEDLLVVGAAAVHLESARGGRLLAATPIDAATIRPRVDAYGWPGPDEAVFEQWIQGLVAASFTREELIFSGLYRVSYTPYPKSAVEYLCLTVEMGLRTDQWNRAWLVDGNTPSDLLALPEDWKPGQIQQWTEYWDAMLAGDSRGRQKTKFVPGGTERVGTPSRKDQDFELFQLWILRRCCAVLGVQPASIGFAGEQYKVSQEKSLETTTAFGAGVLLDWRQAHYDDLLRRGGYGDLECRNVTAREEAAGERAERLARLVAGGIYTPNEARACEGLDPVEGGEDLLVPSTLRPLAQALEPPPIPGAGDDAPGHQDAEDEDAERALRLWERKALRRLKEGRGPAAPFRSAALDAETGARIAGALAECRTAEEVREVFRYEGQPRDEKGQFAAGKQVADGAKVRIPGREPESAASAAAKVVALHRAGFNHEKQSWGSTYSLYAGDLRGKDLWSVSIFPDEHIGRRVSADLFGPEHVAQFIADNQELLADPRCAVGTWEKHGTVLLFLDVAVLVQDREKALALGKQYNQEAIYHLLTGEEVAAGGTGEAVDSASLPPVSERLKGIPSWLSARNV